MTLLKFLCRDVSFLISDFFTLTPLKNIVKVDGLSMFRMILLVSNILKNLYYFFEPDLHLYLCSVP